MEQALNIAIDSQNYKTAARLMLHSLADGKLLYFALQQIHSRFGVKITLQFLNEIRSQEHHTNHNKIVEQFMGCIIHGLRMNNITLLEFLLCQRTPDDKYITLLSSKVLPEEFFNSLIMREIAKHPNCIPSIQNAALCGAIAGRNIEDANKIALHIRPENIYSISKIIREGVTICMSPLVLAEEKDYHALHETLEKRRDSYDILYVRESLNEAIENNYTAFVQYVADRIDDEKILEENILVDYSLLSPIEYAIHLHK